MSFPQRSVSRKLAPMYRSLGRFEASQARKLPNRPRERRIVIVAVAFGDQPVLESRRQGGNRKHRSCASRELECDCHVFAMQRDLETERVGVLDHASAAVLEGP